MGDVGAVVRAARAVLGSGDGPGWAPRSFGDPVPDVPSWCGVAADSAHAAGEALNVERQQLGDTYVAVGPLVEQAGQLSVAARARVDWIDRQWQADKAAFAPIAHTAPGKLALVQLGAMWVEQIGATLKQAHAGFAALAGNVNSLIAQLPQNATSITTTHALDYTTAPQLEDGSAPGDVEAIERANGDLLDEMERDYQQLPAGQVRSDRLADIAAIREGLGVEDSHLIFLERPDSPDQMIPAAIAVGDPYTADHVSVSVPGVSSSTRGAMAGMTREAWQLRKEARAIARRTGESQNVATIAWTGYQPPPNLGSSDVLTDDLAQAGAPKLNTFLHYLDAASRNPGHTMALFGHSYGSLTSGIALKDGASGIVDNTVLYGSPGFEATSPAKLGLNDHNFFVMATPDDPINTLGAAAPLHGWGSNPNEIIYSLGEQPRYRFPHLETQAGMTPLGDFKTGASGHSEYPRNALEQMTGYNLAAVLLDRADLAVPEGPPWK